MTSSSRSGTTPVGGAWIVDDGTKTHHYISDATVTRAINLGYIQSIKKRTLLGCPSGREASIQWFGTDGHCDASAEFVDHIPDIPWLIDLDGNPDARAEYQKYLLNADRSAWKKRMVDSKVETRAILAALQARVTAYREQHTRPTP